MGHSIPEALNPKSTYRLQCKLPADETVPCFVVTEKKGRMVSEFPKYISERHQKAKDLNKIVMVL